MEHFVLERTEFDDPKIVVFKLLKPPIKERQVVSGDGLTDEK